jgi:hypothetical protein
MSAGRTYRAGDSLEDFCRACKTDRMHIVVAVDADGWPLRVTCGYCRSEHRFRGGPRIGPSSSPWQFEQDDNAGAGDLSTEARSAKVEQRPPRRQAKTSDPFPIVADRERSAPPIMLPDESTADLEMLLRRIIREETGISAVTPADKWRGGHMVLRPGTPGVQEKSWPIETFFHKVVMLRNRLRTLEQQVNASDLPEDAKVKLQGYVSGCYGTLTSFNVLFADEDDQFRGSSGE